ncbi:unnamed protein product [Durusdinium trenchii]|uniref:Uncharacterized protein n=1 Tax=Durusdinium trenchii TaxID=1381693 RepID=A0ABP0S3P7_9DINO
MQPLTVGVEVCGRILRLETSEGDTLERVHQLLEDVPTSGGRRLLSLGHMHLQSHEVIADTVERYVGATGRSFSDVTFSVVDFGELANSRGTPCWIPDTAHRGMTLHQMHRVLHFMGHQAFAWHEAHRDSPNYGSRISEEKFNLYHASYWIINPATQGYGPFGCSFVELIAEEKEAQRPKWFVSHAWLEPVCLFVANLSRHAHVRQLELNTAFWVCAYANNQHHLEADVGEHPRRSSFYRAMQRCEGVVLLLDDQATPFLRIWCCFEEAIAVEKRNANERRLLLDVCATDADGVAHVITDGLAGIEKDMVPLLGLHHKTCREMTFPVRILERGLRINILSASASHEADRTRILNSIAFPHAPLEDLSAIPPEEHSTYQTVNCALSAQFALASWCNCILHGWDAAPLARALSADSSRRAVQLSFTGCTRFSDQDLAMLVDHLPESLEVLRLDLGFTGLRTLEALEELRRCKSLVHLELRFPGCKFLRSAAGLGSALAALPQLRMVALWFSKLVNLEDIEGLDEAFPTLSNLECLALNLDRCPKVRLEDRKALFKSVKKLRRKGVLESWVHIHGVEQESTLARLLKRCQCSPKARAADHTDPIVKYSSERPIYPPVLLGRHGPPARPPRVREDCDSVGLQVQKAWYLLQAAKHSGLRPELWKATHVVRQAAQSLQWMDALDLTEFLADKGYAFHEDLRQSKVLVHSLAGRWTFCLQDLEKIQSDRYLRVQPLARTMRAGVSADAWPTVLQLLQCVATDTSQLRRGATAKRRTLLNVALSAFAAARDRQEPLLEQALSEAYAKTSLPWIRANDLMKNIKVTSLRPSRRSWNLVLAAGARNSTWRATCDMVRRRAAEGVRMDDMALEKLLKALSLSQAWPMASWILEDQLHQLRFARHSKRLSRAALQAAAARAAEEWCVVRPAPFQRQSWVKALCLMEARGTACVSQRAVLEGMLAACARTMETSRAIKLLQSAYARSVQVSGAAHSFAMHAAALKSRWGLSLMLYDDLRHSGSRPTDVTINNLAIAFRHLPRKWASAGLLFQEIQAQALRLNAIFLGNAVRGSSSSRQWQEAVELCRVTRVVQLRCDAYVFNNAMSGMGRLAQWRQTLQFMEEARETQVFTSDPTSLGERVSQHRYNSGVLVKALVPSLHQNTSHKRVDASH